MTESDFIYFKCIEIKQPIGEFYVGAMLYSQVLSISFADVRRMEARDVERYIGIQRTLEDKRVDEIKEYVRTSDASFPTSVILAVEEKDAFFDDKNSIMRIRKSQDVARIIDGQHRIAGLVNYQGVPFQLSVTICIGMDIEDQAHLFATINLKQKKVDKSLQYDLFEFATKRSPQKTCHYIARVLDSKNGSPFFHRIKILGRATGRGKEFITQAAMVERIIIHISRDHIAAMQDRNALRNNMKIVKASVDEEKRGLFFRNMFIDGRDDEIALVVWNFFTAVATKWPEAWNTSAEGYVLNRSLGFAALNRVLAKIYIAMDRIGEVPSVADFLHYLTPVALVDDDMTKTRFIPGSGGESLLYKTLLAEIGLL